MINPLQQKNSDVKNILGESEADLYQLHLKINDGVIPIFTMKECQSAKRTKI